MIPPLYNSQIESPFRSMKVLLSTLLLTVSLVGHTQTITEINLSKNLDNGKMGSWSNGDYSIFVDLAILSENFRMSSKKYLEADQYYSNTDSTTSIYFMHTSKRYQFAAEQIEKAGNGFDLRKLILYHGIENETDNIGNCQLVEEYIMQLVENGTANVYFKKERIYQLRKILELKGETILDHGYETCIYYDDPKNCVFKEYEHLGW